MGNGGNKNQYQLCWAIRCFYRWAVVGARSECRLIPMRKSWERPTLSWQHQTESFITHLSVTTTSTDGSLTRTLCAPSRSFSSFDPTLLTIICERQLSHNLLKFRIISPLNKSACPSVCWITAKAILKNICFGESLASLVLKLWLKFRLVHVRPVVAGLKIFIWTSFSREPVALGVFTDPDSDQERLDTLDLASSSLSETSNQV